MITATLLLPFLMCDAAPFAALTSSSPDIRLGAAVTAFDSALEHSDRIEVFSIQPPPTAPHRKVTRLDGKVIRRRVAFSSLGWLARFRVALRSAISIRPPTPTPVARGPFLPRHAIVLHSPGCLVDVFIQFDDDGDTVLYIEDHAVMGLVAAKSVEPFLDRLLRMQANPSQHPSP
jgi:hypothetical protein